MRLFKQHTEYARLFYYGYLDSFVPKVTNCFTTHKTKLHLDGDGDYMIACSECNSSWLAFYDSIYDDTDDLDEVLERGMKREIEKLGATAWWDKFLNLARKAVSKCG